MSSLSVQNAYFIEMLKQAGLDAEAQAVAQRIQIVLTDEIHHRMKNMLTVVTAIVRQSMRAATKLVFRTGLCRPGADFPDIPNDSRKLQLLRGDRTICCKLG
jgi:hypothetical protein